MGIIVVVLFQCVFLGFVVFFVVSLVRKFTIKNNFNNNVSSDKENTGKIKKTFDNIINESADFFNTPINNEEVKKDARELKDNIVNSFNNKVNNSSESKTNKKDIRCPHCYSLNPIENDFCYSCGKEIILECPNCHEINDRKNNYCSKCGHKF